MSFLKVIEKTKIIQENSQINLNIHDKIENLCKLFTQGSLNSSNTLREFIKGTFESKDS